MKLIKFDSPLSSDQKGMGIMVVLMLLSNVLMYNFTRGPIEEYTPTTTRTENLFLLNEAKVYLNDESAFEEKVRQVSDQLNIPPEWLMAVMHSESRFDASVANHKGSGATGLIQFMPNTAKDFGITVEKLRNMNHTEQLDYVYEYLNSKRNQYKEFESLTDLYLAILYPVALGEETCYTMYARPSKAYEMNKVLDENKDGRVSVQDIDKRMQRVYPTAYIARSDSDAKPFFGLFSQR